MGITHHQQVEKISNMFHDLKAQKTDPLLALIGLFKSDQRTNKIDLGVGVYRDEDGLTPVLKAVKSAEQYLIENQTTKSYLGPLGNQAYTEHLAAIVFGKGFDSKEIFGIQTVGGTGALRLGADLIKKAGPNTTVWLGNPSWVNHAPVFNAVSLEIKTYAYYKPQSQTINFEETVDAFEKAKRGDIMLLQGCCHNPTGVDLTLEQWKTLGSICEKNGLIPFIDIAYQGLGKGLKEDREGVTLFMDMVPEAIVSVSCSKNFGLYRERTGALYVKANQSTLPNLSSSLMNITRPNYSMPPDHGAAIVETILSDAALTKEWHAELTVMRNRINTTRRTLVENLHAKGVMMPAIQEQYGMFSMLPLTAQQILTLREDHAVYMADNGRINVAGLKSTDIPVLAKALAKVV